MKTELKRKAFCVFSQKLLLVISKDIVRKQVLKGKSIL